MSLSIFFILQVLSFLCLQLIVFFEVNEFDLPLLYLSCLLFSIWLSCLAAIKQKLNAYVFFSLLFFGYAVSGLYFSWLPNIEKAKFFNLYGDFGLAELRITMLIVIVSFICLSVGYKAAAFFTPPNKHLEWNIKAIQLDSVTTTIIYCLYLSSFCYWLYISYVLAGGPIYLLQNMGIYHLMLEKNPISTAPYLIAYASCMIIFLIALTKRQINIYIIIMILVSFLMYMSTGRLSGAISYLAFFPLTWFLVNNRKISLKEIFVFMLFIILLGFAYFYRLYSNLAYIGTTFEEDFLVLIGDHLISNTNIGDLQSIVFAKKYISDFGLFWGTTFFDSVKILLSLLRITEIDDMSIGTRLKEAYFSDFETGAPAPGIISELIINYGVYGSFIGIFIIGYLLYLIERFLRKKNTIVGSFLLSQFLIFVALLVKVDSSHLMSLFWSVAPVLALFYATMSFDRGLKREKWKYARGK